MSNHLLTIAVVLLYFAIILFIGYAAGKKTKNMADFMVSGRSLGVWMLSFGVMAAVMSGWSWLGNPGAVYAAGYSAHVRISSLTPLGVILAFVIVGRPIRIISNQTECFTMPDILAARWNNSTSIRLLSCIIILIGSATYLVSQWSSMGTVMQAVLNVSYRQGVIIGAVIISLYVAAGGMLASMWTNFIQMVIMFVVAIVIVLKGVNAVGGFTQMNLTVAAIDPSYIRPFNAASPAVTSLSYSVLVVLLAYAGQPGFNTKFLMIRDQKQLRWAPLISVIAMMVGTSMYLIGLVGKIMVTDGTIAAPASNDGILLAVVAKLFSPALVAIVMTAIMAAVMSTAETHLFASGTSLVQDLAVRCIGIKIEEKKCLLYMRLVIFATTLLTVILALGQVDMIAKIGSQAFGALCAGFGPTLCLGLRWKRVNAKAATAGMIVGLVFGGILPVVDPANVLLGQWTPAGVGVVLSAAVIIVVSLVTKPEHSAVFDFAMRK